MIKDHSSRKIKCWSRLFKLFSKNENVFTDLKDYIWMIHVNHKSSSLFRGS